ncbi:sulfotransferase [Lacimicrobium sp. SS2-24]|uniref:tetratricopeptide repeat-containing sulfotransferase family protein n=1 Tax=Lacimicrobium sp. SS2-24 TaxID=2005569 RepID=UPI000B4C0A49|nr:sulfotransferase [Lacimicrobium sp. SS2-24]
MDEQALDQLKQHFSQGRLADVEAGASELLKTYPEHPLLHKMTGICLFQRGQYPLAQQHFETALKLEPDDANCLNNLGSCYLFQNQHSKAAGYFKQALSQADNPEWHRNLGTCYFELGFFIRAAAHYDKAIKGGINDDVMLLRQVETLRQASLLKRARAVAEQIRDVAERAVALAEIYVAGNRPKQAKASLKGPGQLHFSHPQLQRLHNVYRFLGERDNELSVVNRFADRSSPEQKLLAAVMQPELSAQQLAALEQDPRLVHCHKQVKATFYFLLASHYKKRDRTRWLALLKQANQIQAGGQPVSVSKELECFERIKRGYKGYAGFEVNQGSKKPVFVLGMPRSGTTLIESILGNHPDIFAAGESTLVENLLTELNPNLPEEVHPHQLRLHYLAADLSEQKMQQFSERYLSALSDYDADAQYITDKMPHNFMHLGWLARALPGATFIHCERDPVATCLSIFEQNLSPFHRYGNDLATLAEYYQGYQSLMGFWKQKLGKRLISVNYEALVKAPRQTLSPVLAHLGLDWQDSLLDLEQSERSITTSSLEQIRKGIYTDALTPYAGLEQDLAPLMVLHKDEQTTSANTKSVKPSWFKRWFG